MNADTARQNPLITVIVPTYNGGKYLRAQIESIIQQTYPNLEILIIDDSSTDNTREVLNEYSATLNCNIVFNEKNLGVNANFEKAIRLSKGDLLAFSDQDDIWTPDKLQKLADAIGDHTLAYANSALIDQSGRSLNKTLHDKLKITHIKGKHPFAFFFFNCVPGHAMLIKRADVEKALPIPVATLYDHWIAYIASQLNGIMHVDEFLVRHRQHTDSVINSTRETKKKAKPRTLSLAYLEHKIQRRAKSAEHRAQSLMELAGSRLTPAGDKLFLTNLAGEFGKYKHTFFSIRLFILLFGRRHEIYRLKGGVPTLRCLRESTGAKLLRIWPWL